MSDNPFGFQWGVTVTTRTRRGTRKIRQFTRIRGRWYDSFIGSRKQIAAARNGEYGWTMPTRPGAPPSPPPPATIRLAQGLDLPKSTMDTILDAVRAAKKHQVDVAGIRVVVSQLGGRIAAFNQLSPGQRRHAQPALYTQILAALY